MLTTTECIGIINGTKEYTDCMEFSLLRFLQLCLYDSKQVAQTGVSDWGDFFFKHRRFNINPHINSHINIESSMFEELEQFTVQYPQIYSSGTYYNINKEGKEQRSNWAKFVSDRDFLDYYRNDRAELFTSPENIFKFFNGFFNMELQIDLDTQTNKQVQENFDAISKKFSNKNKHIAIKVKDVVCTKKYMIIEEILRYISRPVESEYLELQESGEEFDVIFKTTTLDMQIDNFNYNWMLYEVYFENHNPKLIGANKFITGHSVIYNK